MNSPSVHALPLAGAGGPAYRDFLARGAAGAGHRGPRSSGGPREADTRGRSPRPQGLPGPDRRDAVLIIKGTVPDEQGRGYMRLLSRELLRALRAGGYSALRSTFVERSNPGSAAQ